MSVTDGHSSLTYVDNGCGNRLCWLWIDRVGLTMRRSLPVFTHKQTSSGRADWSVPCQFWAHERNKFGSLVGIVVRRPDWHRSRHGLSFKSISRRFNRRTTCSRLGT